MLTCGFWAVDFELLTVNFEILTVNFVVDPEKQPWEKHRENHGGFEKHVKTTRNHNSR